MYAIFVWTRGIGVADGPAVTAPIFNPLAHMRREGYGSRLACVYVYVCLSVC